MFCHSVPDFILLSDCFDRLYHWVLITKHFGYYTPRFPAPTFPDQNKFSVRVSKTQNKSFKSVLGKTEAFYTKTLSWTWRMYLIEFTSLSQKWLFAVLQKSLTQIQWRAVFKIHLYLLPTAIFFIYLKLLAPTRTNLAKRSSGYKKLKKCNHNRVARLSKALSNGKTGKTEWRTEMSGCWDNLRAAVSVPDSWLDPYIFPLHYSLFVWLLKNTTEIISLLWINPFTLWNWISSHKIISKPFFKKKKKTKPHLSCECFHLQH